MTNCKNVGPRLDKPCSPQRNVFTFPTKNKGFFNNIPGFPFLKEVLHNLVRI